LHKSERKSVKGRKEKLITEAHLSERLLSLCSLSAQVFQQAKEKAARSSVCSAGKVHAAYVFGQLSCTASEE
jgi:hypothetical protein